MPRFRPAFSFLVALYLVSILSPFCNAGDFCRFMIIVPDSVYKNAVTPLVDWKKQIGFSSCIAQLDQDINPSFSDEPDEATRIWKYLQEAEVT